MGQHRQLPERLRALHPKFRTPYIAIIVFGLIACLTILPGQADFLGTDLRVRGDAVVHDRAPRGDRAAHQAARRASGRSAAPARSRSAATSCRCSRVFGGLGTGIAWVVVTVLNISTLIAGHGLAGDRHHAPTSSTGAARACRSRETAQDRRCPSRWSSTRSSTSRCWWRSRTADYSPEAVATAVQAGGAAAARHPRAGRRSPCRPTRRSTRRCPSRRRTRAVDDRLGARARRPARDRALGEGAPGPGRPADRRGGARDPRPRDGDVAAAAAHRRVAVRAHARDRAGGAALPGDHRVVTRRPTSRQPEPLGRARPESRPRSAALRMPPCSAPTGARTRVVGVSSRVARALAMMVVTHRARGRARWRSGVIARRVRVLGGASVRWRRAVAPARLDARAARAGRRASRAASARRRCSRSRSARSARRSSSSSAWSRTTRSA